MYLLAEVFPFLRRWSIPINRDQFILLMVAFNELMLGVDTYLAHSISGTIKPFEWIPVMTGLIREGVIITERFIRGAPLLAPMLFANMALLGLLLLFDPQPGNKNR